MIDLQRVIEDTQSLIHIDSQNPGIQEKQCVEWTSQRLISAGFEPKRTVVRPGRENLTVTIPGQGKAPRLVLLGHLDTVPIGAGWTKPPLEGVIENGKIYGRGACDMKGGVAVALGLLETLKQIGRAHV